MANEVRFICEAARGVAAPPSIALLDATLPSAAAI
jgi:hypothetical protein